MMTWIDWIPAVSMSTLLAVLGFLAGTYYKAKVENSVEHNFSRELEQLKAFHREREMQIDTLTRTALSGMSNQHAMLDKRRIEAIEKLWSSIVRWTKVKFALKMTASIKIEAALEAVVKQDADAKKLKDFADLIWQVAGLDNIQEQEAGDLERPFVTPLAWALYSTYRKVLGFPLAQLAALRSGLGDQFLADPKDVLELTKTALPHQTELIDRLGTTALSYLVDELEEKLFTELATNLGYPSSEDERLKQAARILSAAENVPTATMPKVDLPEVDGIRA